MQKGICVPTYLSTTQNNIVNTTAYMKENEYCKYQFIITEEKKLFIKIISKRTRSAQESNGEDAIH